MGRGFCIFNNVVMAIEHARATRGVGRVATTVDWDVHHGNGTQAAFYRRADVLIRGAGLAVIWPQHAALAAIGAALFSLSLSRFRRTIGALA